jgi:type VI secretion system secreted protein Hcp
MAEMFLLLDNVPGESIDQALPKAHAGEIEIKSWGWKTTNKVSWNVNQGGQSTKADIGEITIQKTCDRASTFLYQCCITGKHILNGVITCRKSDGDQKVEYLKVRLKDIMVSHVEWSGDGDSQLLSETIELSCAEFHLEYQVQDETGNTPGGGVTFGWNLQQQKAVG